MRGARLIFVNTPSNPSGCVLDESSLTKIIALANKHDVLIISDEVYEHYCYEDKFRSLATFPGAQGRTLTMNSFSKSFGMAGVRVGYLAGDASIIRALRMQMIVRCPFVGVQGQGAAYWTLKNKSPIIAKCQQEVKDKARWVAEQLSQEKIAHTPLRGSVYAWINTSPLKMNGEDFCRQLMRDERVLMMPGNNFGPSGEYFARLAFTPQRPIVAEGLKRLVKFWNANRI